MRTYAIRLTAAACLGFATLTARAQDDTQANGPDGRSRRPPPHVRATPESDRHPDAARSPAEGQGPLDRWMEILRRRDPEQHARLETLRREDREAFREALREHLSALHRARGGPPSANGESSEGRRGSRTWRTARPEQAHAIPRLPPPPPDERISAIEGELSALALRYQAGGAGRDAARAEMQRLLDTWFDLKHAQADQRIRRAEAQLDHLRRALAESLERRDDLLAQRLEALLGTEAE